MASLLPGLAASASAPGSPPTDTSSDSGSSSSEPIIEYAKDASGLPRTGEGFTTRKGKDYRPASTFYLKKWKDQTFAERICSASMRPELEPMYYIQNVDRGPVPRWSMGQVIHDNLFTLAGGLLPIVIQSMAYWLYPADVLSHGVFDERNFGRDRIPDGSVNTIARGVVAFLFFRPGLSFILHYKMEESPLLSIGLDFPLRLIGFILVYDYFFYTYHRSCHDFDFLWSIHKHHHTTKHPTALLAILADGGQELIEIGLVPIITSLLVPMTFAELHLTLIYIFGVEVAGHTGVRAAKAHPVLWFLKWFDADLILEDHDLHHRNGKSGLCYGKQGGLWDKLFGTLDVRIESKGGW